MATGYLNTNATRGVTPKVDTSGRSIANGLSYQNSDPRSTANNRSMATKYFEAGLSGYGFNKSEIRELTDYAMKLYREGFDPSTIVQAFLPTTNLYKSRFPANAAREKAGLPPLSASQYYDLEDSYRNSLKQYGLPKGFYDQRSDFNKWIAGGVSPQEIADRAKKYSDIVNNLNPDVLKYQQSLGRSKGDLAALFMDQKKAAPLLDRYVKASEVGGAALTAGMQLTEKQANALVRNGITGEAAQAAIYKTKTTEDNMFKLANIDGANVNEWTLTKDALGVSPEATKKVNKLVNNEQARFAGTGGNTAKLFNRNTSGAI